MRTSWKIVLVLFIVDIILLILVNALAVQKMRNLLYKADKECQNKQDDEYVWMYRWQFTCEQIRNMTKSITGEVNETHIG